MHDPIAYTYEADTHCPSCTETRFGPNCEGTDAEGNEVGAIFSWTEWQSGETKYGRETLSCGTCLNVIEETDPYLPGLASEITSTLESGTVPSLLSIFEGSCLTIEETFELLEGIFQDILNDLIPFPDPADSCIDWPAKLAAWNHAITTDGPRS